MTKMDLYRMVDLIGEPAMLEMMAEEAAEFSKACLKLSRIRRGENPTPLTYMDGWNGFREELADVRLCLRAYEERYGQIDTEALEAVKETRWRFRMMAAPGAFPELEEAEKK